MITTKNTTPAPAIEGEYPRQFPRAPGVISKWQPELDSWWFDFRTVLMRSNTDALQSEIRSLTERVTELERLVAILMQPAAKKYFDRLYCPDDGHYHAVQVRLIGGDFRTVTGQNALPDE